jgi:hypothetical protein
MSKVIKTYLKIVEAFIKVHATVTIRAMDYCNNKCWYMFIRITHGDLVLDIDILPSKVTVWNSLTAKDCNDDHTLSLEELDVYLKTFED